jgi:hypothetical protein
MHIRNLYSDLVKLLTLSQFRKLMGGDMSYKSKAQRAMLVSKSKKVHYLAKQIINLCEETK